MNIQSHVEVAATDIGMPHLLLSALRDANLITYRDTCGQPSWRDVSLHTCVEEVTASPHQTRQDRGIIAEAVGHKL